MAERILGVDHAETINEYVSAPQLPACMIMMMRMRRKWRVMRILMMKRKKRMMILRRMRKRRRRKMMTTTRPPTPTTTSTTTTLNHKHQVNLGMYSFAGGQVVASLRLFYRALHLLLVCVGDTHPDVAVYYVSGGGGEYDYGENLGGIDNDDDYDDEDVDAKNDDGHALICSIKYSFIFPLIHSFIYSSIHLSIHPFIYLLIHSPIDSSIN